MPNQDLIYGGRANLAASIAAATAASRPSVLVISGDSIVNRWGTNFVRRIKGLVGYCSEITGLYNYFNGSAYVNTGDGIAVPTNPGAYVARYGYFSTYAHTGTGVSTGATSAGTTTMPISLSSGGLPDLTFPIVIGTGGTQETVYLDPSWTGSGSPALTTPLIFSAPLAFAHASGSTISWQRPSGQTAYWPGGVTEVTFATAASPQNVSQYAGRLMDAHGLGDQVSFLELPEGQMFSDGYIMSRFSVNLYLFYLALPVNIGAPNLTLHGMTAEASPAHVTVNFSIYAATPTIKCVKLTIPAPTTYLKTVTWRATVNSPNAGSFTAGQVFVAIKLVAVRAGATSGTIAISATTGGMRFGDLTGDPARYGPQWTVAMRQQFITAMASVGLGTIDQLMVHLGTNDTFVNPAGTFAQISQCATDMQSANSSAMTLYVSDYATTNNIGSGQGPNMSAATQLIEGSTTIVGFDQYAMTDMTAAEITNLILSDGTHPEPAAGYAFVGNRIANFYAAAPYPSPANVLLGIKTPAGVGTLAYPTVAQLLAAAVTPTDGTAQAGSATTVTLAASDNSVTNSLASRSITIVFGTGAGQSTLIVSNNSSTKVVTVAPTFATAPDSTSQYKIGPTTYSAYVVGGVGGTVGGIATAGITSASFSAGSLAAAAFAAGALNGKGDWLLATGYTAAPGTIAIQAAILATTNPIFTDASGRVKALDSSGNAFTYSSPTTNKKNTAFPNFEFLMTDSTTRLPRTGLTVTAQRSLDGQAFTACTNSPTELSNGIYVINLSAADLNANTVSFRFSAASANDTVGTLFTQP